MNKESAVPVSSSKRVRRRGNWFTRTLILAAALICIVFIAREFIVAAVSRVELLSRREAGQTTFLEGILIKEEKVIRAPANGKLHYTASDGERLEVGAGAAQVFASDQESGGETFKLFTPYAGIFCTHIDSLESILTPGNLDVLDLPKLEKIGSRPIPEGGRVEKGQPVFKIIDNLSPLYIYAQIPKTACPQDLAERPMWMQAAWENLNFLMKPLKLRDRGDRWDGLFLLSGYPEAIVHMRRVRINVTTNKLSGLLVPRGAVVYRDGEPGIFIVDKKKALWAPVRIEGELAGEVAVSGPHLSENTRYVSNPVLVRDKWPVE